MSTVFATNYIWTSFFKVGSPITLPATQFVSGGVTSGNYTSGGQLLFQIGQSGANYSMLPLLDANGVAYSTGVDINYRTNIGSNIYNNNTGNVGIGTATPTKALDVS